MRKYILLIHWNLHWLISIRKSHSDLVFFCPDSEWKFKKPQQVSLVRVLCRSIPCCGQSYNNYSFLETTECILLYFQWKSLFDDEKIPQKNNIKNWKRVFISSRFRNICILHHNVKQIITQNRHATSQCCTHHNIKHESPMCYLLVF